MQILKNRCRILLYANEFYRLFLALLELLASLELGAGGGGCGRLVAWLGDVHGGVDGVLHRADGLDVGAVEAADRGGTLALEGAEGLLALLEAVLVGLALLVVLAVGLGPGDVAWVHLLAVEDGAPAGVEGEDGLRGDEVGRDEALAVAGVDGESAKYTLFFAHWK